MKLEDFKITLRGQIEHICKENKWTMDNNKQRGMAFENWCFDLFTKRYPTAENELNDSVLRGDDQSIDIVFESKETEEVFLIQAKHPKLQASDPISEDNVKEFFSTYVLFKDDTYFKDKAGVHTKVGYIVSEINYWRKSNFTLTFLFISNGRLTEGVQALAEKYSKDFLHDNVKFIVWGINELKDEWLDIQSVEESYPAHAKLQLSEDGFFSLPALAHQNLTFAISGNALKDLAHQYKDSLFNLNIRRYLGKKGQVNTGLSETIAKQPENFFYFNNGISALCDSFSFDKDFRELNIAKLQIVNGAQTVGAIKVASQDDLKNVRVLVKLTAIKHHAKEQGIASTLIRTNNTQNSLRIPDFRSNDQIQLWLEKQFRDTKARGNLLKIVYGRKRPYSKTPSDSTMLKLQDAGKIRYAWLHDPRTPIAEPARLFLLPEDGGLYWYAFGVDGNQVTLWTESQFNDFLLAIYCYRRISEDLARLQEKK